MAAINYSETPEVTYGFPYTSVSAGDLSTILYGYPYSDAYARAVLGASTLSINLHTEGTGGIYLHQEAWSGAFKGGFDKSIFFPVDSTPGDTSTVGLLSCSYKWDCRILKGPQEVIRGYVMEADASYLARIGIYRLSWEIARYDMVIGSI